MTTKTTDPANNYLANHPRVKPIDIHRWKSLARMLTLSHVTEFAYEDWQKAHFKTLRRISAPDLIEWVAWYGYIKLRLLTWKLPIKLTAAELLEWREAGYYVTPTDFRVALSNVAAGFVDVAGNAPKKTAALIELQLDKKLRELKKLSKISVKKNYTPQFTEAQIRNRCMKLGLSGYELKTAILDALQLHAEEYDHETEVERLNRPFELRQQLASFRVGLEIYLMLIAEESAPQLKNPLPNPQLLKALQRIDLVDLDRQLAEIDRRLRLIWETQAKYGCFDLNASYEPGEFWWRHWPESSA